MADGDDGIDEVYRAIRALARAMPPVGFVHNCGLKSHPHANSTFARLQTCQNKDRPQQHNKSQGRHTRTNNQTSSCLPSPNFPCAANSSWIQFRTIFGDHSLPPPSPLTPTGCGGGHGGWGGATEFDLKPIEINLIMIQEN